MVYSYQTIIFWINVDQGRWRVIAPDDNGLTLYSDVSA